MVSIDSADEIKRVDKSVRASFSKVRADINDLRKSISGHFFEIEQLSKKAELSTTREEFHSFVKDLIKKLDHLEQRFADKKLLEKNRAEFSSRIESLRSDLRLRDDVEKDIGMIKKIKRQLSDLEGKSVDRNEFYEETKGLEQQLSNIKLQVNNLENIRQDVKEFNGLRNSIEQLEKNFVSWKDFFKKTKDIKEIVESNYESVESMKREFNSLRKAISSTKETETDVSKIKEALDNMYKQIQGFEQNFVTKQKIHDIEYSINELKRIKEKEPKEKERIPPSASEKDVRSIKDELSYITHNIVTQADLSARLGGLEDEIAELQKNVKILKAKKAQPFGDFAIKLEEPVSERIGEEKPGIINKTISKISEFFKEEEEKPSEKVKELIREEEKKETKEELKERSPFVKYLFLAFVLIILMGGGYFIFSKLKTPTALIIANITNMTNITDITMNITKQKATNVTSYDEKLRECILTYECQPHENQTWYGCYYNENDQKCHCYLGEQSKCNPGKVAAYTEKPGILSKAKDFIFRNKFLLGGVLVIIILLVFVLFIMGGKEESEEEVVDLEDFFKEKREDEKKPSVIKRFVGGIGNIFKEEEEEVEIEDMLKETKEEKKEEPKKKEPREKRKLG